MQSEIKFGQSSHGTEQKFVVNYAKLCMRIRKP